MPDDVRKEADAARQASRFAAWPGDPWRDLSRRLCDMPGRWRPRTSDLRHVRQVLTRSLRARSDQGADLVPGGRRYSGASTPILARRATGHGKTSLGDGRAALRRKFVCESRVEGVTRPRSADTAAPTRALTGKSSAGSARRNPQPTVHSRRSRQARRGLPRAIRRARCSRCSIGQNHAVPGSLPDVPYLELITSVPADQRTTSIRYSGDGERREVIELSGYTDREKLEIAKRTVPKHDPARRGGGAGITFTDEPVLSVIYEYTASRAQKWTHSASGAQTVSRRRTSKVPTRASSPPRRERLGPRIIKSEKAVAFEAPGRRWSAWTPQAERCYLEPRRCRVAAAVLSPVS